MLAFEEIEGEGLVVECGKPAWEPLGVNPDKSIHRPHRRGQREPAALADRVEEHRPSGMQPAARPRQVEDRLVAPEGGLHGKLAGHVRAEPQGRQQIDRVEIIPGMLPLA